jgi:head-tail adaptor
MRAGPLRYRLQLQAATITKDTLGAPKKTWVDLGEWVYADVRAMSAREYFSALSQDVGAPSYQIIIRKDPGIKYEPGMRALDLDEGTEYDITAELPSPRRDYMTLLAVSGKGAS